jgi:beta-xylosidase
MGTCVLLLPRGGLSPAVAARTRTYTNPVFARDFPDPMVLWYHGWYYAYGTTAQWQRLGVVFPILKSLDLVHWRYVADAMPSPSWGTGDWWAPDVLYNRRTFYMYYVGMSMDKQVHCIGVATSKSPTGPFGDHGPLACEDRSGQGYIDPAPFVDTDGRAYLYFSVDSPHHSISVLRLAPDLLHTMGPRTELFGISQPWERGPYFSTVEGPFVIKRRGLYYCFYSGNDWQHDYAMGYATASRPLGPFTKNSRNPILRGTAQVKGPGGGSIILGPQGAESWLVYHAWDPTHSFRDLRIDHLIWHKGAADVQGPTATPQPIPPHSATSPGELAPPADRAFVMR